MKDDSLCVVIRSQICIFDLLNTAETEIERLNARL